MQRDHELEQALRKATRFQTLRHVEVSASTQDLVSPERPGEIAWADHQTRGRGRETRIWHDESGTDIAATFCHVMGSMREPLCMPMLVPLAVSDAIAASCQLEARVKWPNDVLLAGRKVAGVLIDRQDSRGGAIATGIGLNVNRQAFPPHLQGLATSLALQCGRTLDRHAVLFDLAMALETRLRQAEAGRFEDLLADYRARLGLIGLPVQARTTDGVRRGVLQDLTMREAVVDAHRVPLGSLLTMRESG